MWNDPTYKVGSKFNRKPFEVWITAIENLGNNSADKYKTFRDSNGGIWTEAYLLENINSGLFIITY